MDVVGRRVADVLGWGGVLCFLLAYILVTYGWLLPTGAGYQLLNILGALGLIIEARGKRDAQVVALNIVWLLLAAFAIIRSALSHS